MLDKAPGDEQLLASQKSLLIGLRQRFLSAFFVGLCYVDGHTHGDFPRLHRGQEPLFAFFQEVTDRMDVFVRKPCLLGDLLVGIAPFAEFANVVKQLKGTVLTSCEVLNQAHDEAVFLGHIDDDGWDLALS